MKRKFGKPIALLLILIIVMAVSGCVGETGNAGASALPQTPTPKATPKAGINTEPIGDYDEIKTIVWLRVAEQPLSSKTLEFILLNFGLKVEEYYFSSNNMTDDITALFSTDFCPDLVTGISVETAKKLAEHGYFENLSEHQTELADYFALWNDWEEGWEYTESLLFEGKKVYFLVPRNRKASLGWIYNKTAFEEDGIKYPETVAELYEILMRYKETHGTTYPLWTSRYEALQFDAILNAYGLLNEKWQTTSYGNVFYLYGDERWYKALEWLVKFEKAGLVPTDDSKQLEAMDRNEYESSTAAGNQIIEFTDTYRYLYIQSAQQGNPDWAVADVMIHGDENSKPVISSNIPYLNEATCISKRSSADAKKQIMCFLNWLATDEGNLWANFGNEGEDYSLENGKITFYKYYSDDITRNIDKEASGSVLDDTVGMMFTTPPLDEYFTEYNRYYDEEQFLLNSGVSVKTGLVLRSPESILKDKTLLWKYQKIEDELDRLTEEFVQFSRVNGFSDYFWDKYYESLIDAGLAEYISYMQMRVR